MGLKNVFEEEFRANPAASFAYCLPKNTLKINKIESILNHGLILDPAFRADAKYMVHEFEKLNQELNMELVNSYRDFIQAKPTESLTPTTSNTFSFQRSDSQSKCKVYTV